MSKGKPGNFGYYCGAKFDTIPTLSILPPLPNHWRSSESKSTPSSPVPTSILGNNMTAGSSVPSGRNTAPVLKATSLPSAAGHGHDFNASFTKMVTARDKVNSCNHPESEIRKQTTSDTETGSSKNKNNKRRGRVHKRESAATVAVHNGAGDSTNTKLMINSSKEGGHLIMAMLQSGRAKTESIETEKVSHSATSYSKDTHSSTLLTLVESFPKLKSLHTISSNPPKQCLYATCQQQNEDSSEHLKALLKVCT